MGNKRLIIAEIGHNFCGDIKLAHDLIHAAKAVGCDIAKFQLYDIDSIKKPGDTNYEELKRSQLTEDQMLSLYETAKKIGIEFLCSTFDIERLGWYMKTNPKRFKIASRSINNIELIKAMRKIKNTPIIASLGAWESKIDKYGLPTKLPRFRADFLYCQSRRDILRHGLKLPFEFDNKVVGYSDHSIGVYAAINAMGRGARIIEKHFTFDLNMPGWDQPSSATPQAMKIIVDYAKHLEGESNGERSKSRIIV